MGRIPPRPPPRPGKTSSKFPSKFSSKHLPAPPKPNAGKTEIGGAGRLVIFQLVLWAALAAAVWLIVNDVTAAEAALLVRDEAIQLVNALYAAAGW